MPTRREGAPPPSRTDPPSYARPVGRPPGQRTGNIPSPVLPPERAAAKGATTFAEMGIQGMKPEEKECVIMCLSFFVLSCRCVGSDLLQWVDFSFT